MEYSDSACKLLKVYSEIKSEGRMQKSIFFLAIVFAMEIFLSCQKKFLCPDCDVNKPPLANAGLDQKITLPQDSVLLDGTASTDPDGKIISYKWIKISGPSSFNIINTDSAKTAVKALVAGVYEIELKVTDNGGLSAKDTVQVLVNDPAQPNRTPVACAGVDQTIILPTNSVTLDGSCSSDADNNITSYLWTNISGPAGFTITNANAVQTQATNLVQGVYIFELKVTDAGGLFSKDTMQLTVNAAVVTVDCYGNIRQRINASLTPIATLSQNRQGITVASAGNKILFAGGYTGNYSSGFLSYSRVDIFDISTNSWTTAELSQPRSGIGTAVLNNKIYLAGGWYPGGYSSRVDIYDVITNVWTTAELSKSRAFLAGAAAGSKVLFAGGYGSNSVAPVDIFDVSTNSWSTDTLRNRPLAGMIGDAGIAATVIGSKIYFAGNASDWFGWDFGSITSTINIYDVLDNTWSTSDLSIPRGFMASIAVGNNNYWAGGVNDQSDNFTSVVEIRDVNSGVSTFSCLSHPNAFFSAVQKNNNIVFFTLSPYVPVDWPMSDQIWQNNNSFDIYDLSNNKWSIGILPSTLRSVSIISVNNTIYVAGGTVNGIPSEKVYKLEF